MQTGPNMSCEIQAPFKILVYSGSASPRHDCVTSSQEFGCICTHLYGHTPKKTNQGQGLCIFPRIQTNCLFTSYCTVALVINPGNLLWHMNFFLRGITDWLLQPLYHLSCIPEQFRRHRLPLAIRPSSPHSESRHSSPTQIVAKYSIVQGARASRNNAWAWGKGKQREASYSTGWKPQVHYLPSSFFCKCERLNREGLELGKSEEQKLHIC